MEIKKNLTTQNYSTGVISRIKYIVIHYTANNGDTALSNTNYFKSYRGASAHYFVDETSVYQSIEDKNIAWHCGANTYCHKECRNHNSIGVELCSYINSKGKYAFKAGTVKNAVWLVKQLMEKYNVPIGNIIRHYDVTHKICPEPYVRDTKAWKNFKAKLTKNTTIQEDDEMVETITLNINGKNYKADRILKDGKNYICLRDLEKAGFTVLYDNDSKIPSLAFSPSDISVFVDGSETKVKAVNINGSNFVPIRYLANMIEGSRIDFNDGKIIINTSPAEN